MKRSAPTSQIIVAERRTPLSYAPGRWYLHRSESHGVVVEMLLRREEVNPGSPTSQTIRAEHRLRMLPTMDR